MELEEIFLVWEKMNDVVNLMWNFDRSCTPRNIQKPTNVYVEFRIVVFIIKFVCEE
jgi:hypothetical protein